MVRENGPLLRRTSVETEFQFTDIGQIHFECPAVILLHSAGDVLSATNKPCLLLAARTVGIGQGPFRRGHHWTGLMGHSTGQSQAIGSAACVEAPSSGFCQGEANGGINGDTWFVAGKLPASDTKRCRSRFPLRKQLISRGVGDETLRSTSRRIRATAAPSACCLSEFRRLAAGGPNRRCSVNGGTQNGAGAEQPVVTGKTPSTRDGQKRAGRNWKGWTEKQVTNVAAYE